MQSQIKSRTAMSENETRIEVRTQAGRWQQPEALKLKPAFVPSPVMFVLSQCHPAKKRQAVFTAERLNSDVCAR
jgi:hypothetical protein